MKIDRAIYIEILEEALKASNVFDGATKAIMEELQEDFATIMEDIDICNHSSTYAGGITKSTHDLVADLKTANSNKDKQQCIESIAMIRSSIMTAESALSNAADSLEKLVVSIRDA